MTGTSMFGAGTMKHGAAVNEAVAWRRQISEMHPAQDAGWRAWRRLTGAA